MTTVATTVIVGTNTTDAANNTSAWPLDALFLATGRSTGANAMHILSAAHKQAHFTQSRNMIARVHLHTLRDALDSSDRSDVLRSRSTKLDREQSPLQLFLSNVSTYCHEQNILAIFFQYIPCMISGNYDLGSTMP